jgi:hypothetical protein
VEREREREWSSTCACQCVILYKLVTLEFAWWTN